MDEIWIDCRAIFFYGTDLIWTDLLYLAIKIWYVTQRSNTTLSTEYLNESSSLHHHFVNLWIWRVAYTANISEHFTVSTIQRAKTRPQHRELCALLFTISVWVFLRPLLTITLKMQETGPTVYTRRLEYITICRCYCKGSIFSSVILRPWVLVRSGTRTRDLQHCSPSLYQLS